MNVIFSTQSDSLRLFSAVHDELNDRVGVGSSGFVVADSLYYKRWLLEKPEFENQGYTILKEWEVTSIRDGKPDVLKLAQLEKELGGHAGLFGAVVADRRLYMGPDCTYSQDYRRRFSDDELLSILLNGVEQVEKLFDEVQPDLVVGFICVTMLDYLVYLVAKARGVSVLNLRPTRVADRVMFGTLLNDPDPAFVESYHKYLDGESTEFLPEAKRYIERVRLQHGRYEGVVKPSDKPALKVNKAGRTVFGIVRKVLSNWWEYRKSIAATDNHVPHPLRTVLFSAIVNPARARMTKFWLAKRYVRQVALKNMLYAFYPLHTEPEVSLLVYGRPYFNQTEIIRMLAMSLPAEMVLVVKEHPWMVGKRPMDAYRNWLNIPRVVIADPAQDARGLVANSSLVAVVTGSVALEAAMLGKPVITFGDCPYNLLPDSMVHRCADPRTLPSTIAKMISEYSSDETALEAYVAAVMATSESVNLYSTLLDKHGVHVDRSSDYATEISRLVDCLLRSLSRSVSEKNSRTNQMSPLW